MTLKEFTALLQAEIASFERKWEEDHASMPIDFPMDMDLPEWWEQFMIANESSR